MIAGQHPGAGLDTDEADREDSAQVARHLILMRMAEIEYSVIFWHKCIRRYSTQPEYINKAASLHVY